MTLEEVRKNIDEVDREIKKLFLKRIALSKNVTEVKAVNGDVIFKPDREKEIVKKLTGDVKEDVLKEYTAFVKKTMSLSRQYQYGKMLEMKELFNIDFYKGKKRYKNPIVLESKYSCVLKNAKTVKMPDAAAAAISQKICDCGVYIADENGIDEHILTYLYKNRFYINKTLVKSQTKTIVFSNELTVSENDTRTEIAFTCPNKSGSLSGMLSVIGDHGRNACDIRTFKFMQDGEPNFLFFIEFEGTVLEKETKAILFQINEEGNNFRILGSY
jgi:chorismate mutase/prephenate dehydratase